MGQTTAITWTHATFNPWIGCTKVAPECAHCYAEAGATRFKMAEWGPHGTRKVTSEAYWSQPLKWNKAAEKSGERRRVFCASMADVFEDWDGPMRDHHGQEMFRCECWPNGDDDEGACTECGSWIDIPLTMSDVRRRLFALIDATPWLDWLLLTKRPENIRRMWPVMHARATIFPGMSGPLGEPQPCIVTDAHRENVFLGTSAGTQESADRFIPDLLKCRDLAPVLFVSCEPMLGPVDLRRHCTECRRWHGGENESWGHDCVADIDGLSEEEADEEFLCESYSDLGIDWLIVGGESNGAKVGRLGQFASEHEWWQHAITLREQCHEAGVPFFFKQGPIDGKIVHEADGFPQEFPQSDN